MSKGLTGNGNIDSVNYNSDAIFHPGTSPKRRSREITVVSSFLFQHFFSHTKTFLTIYISWILSLTCSAIHITCPTGSLPLSHTVPVNFSSYITSKCFNYLSMLYTSTIQHQSTPTTLTPILHHFINAQTTHLGRHTLQRWGTSFLWSWGHPWKWFARGLDVRLCCHCATR